MTRRVRERRRDWVDEEDGSWLLGAGEVRRPFAGRSSSRPRPFIVETQGERHLLFTHDSVQSSMRIDDPYALTCEYTRRMMAFLLFVPEPREIVLIGLGGGSLAKYCYRLLDTAHLVAVEIDADVIALRDEFCIPLDDARFRVEHADGARYLARRAEPLDVLLVDAFDANGVAPSLATPEFYRHAQQRLADRGVLVMNMAGEPSRYDVHMKLAHDAFAGRVLLAPVQSGGNHLLFALNGGVDLDPAALRARAEGWYARLGLDFPFYLRWLQRVDAGGVLRASGNS
jgi:Spermidine synthase